MKIIETRGMYRMRLWYAECGCGWRSAQVTSPTDARRLAIHHGHD